MRVVYSSRVEIELEGYFREGARKFGSRVAKRTLGKIERSLKTTLGRQPYLGQRMLVRDAYRYVIPRTPFVAYYHVDVAMGAITILAIFYGAQDRTEFEGA